VATGLYFSVYPGARAFDVLSKVKESDMIAPKVDPFEARERRLREAAARKGMLFHKAHGDQNHRYVLVNRDPHLIKRSRNVQFPYSFSIDEVESYLAG
jgi:hypothetical protein